jgi:hypothetical protein
MALRFAHRSLAFVALLALGCADPKGEFEAFTARKGPAKTVDGGPDACAPASPADLTGEFLFAIDTQPLDERNPIVFKLISTATADGAGVTANWKFRPLEFKDRTSEITIDGKLQELDLGAFEIDSNGLLDKQLPLLDVTGLANPVTGSDIQAAIKLTGAFCAAGTGDGGAAVTPPQFYCGRASGSVTKPLELTLDTSYTMDRIVNGTFPTPLKVDCAGTEAKPPKQ